MWPSARRHRSCALQRVPSYSTHVMSTTIGDRDPTHVRVSNANANARFKARWNARVAWSMMAAFAAHAALFIFGPSWEAVSFPSTHLSLESGRGFGLPPFADPSSLSGVRLAAVSGLGEPGPSDLQASLQEWGVLADAGVVERSDTPRERPAGGADPSPSVAEPDPEPDVQAEPQPEAEPKPEVEEEIDPEAEPDPEPEAEAEADREATNPGAVASDGRLPAISVEVSTPDPPSSPELSSLDLDRLAALRPRLALLTPEVWVLVRNPTEVEAFLKRSYRRGTLDPAATGSVSVTLWIDERGSVEFAEISKSSGRLDLDEFALALFNEVVVFRAAREQGISVSRSVTFSVAFPW